MARIPLTRVVAPLFLPMVSVTSTANAQDQAPPCPAYEIEGTIAEPTSSGSGTERVASVYVHTTGEPVPSRQVIATFSDSSGAAIGEPTVLVTDLAGRAEVAVPTAADSVNFVAEAPDAPGCVGSDGTDPRVLLEIVPVVAAGEAPANQPGAEQPEETLAKTGPVSDAIALASLLLLGFGAAVGTGRGRRRALARAHGGVKSRFPR